MQHLFKYTVLLIFLASCATQVQTGVQMNKEVGPQLTSHITEKQMPVMINGEQKYLTKVNFENQDHLMLTRQVMFDSFNKWDVANVRKENSLEEILIWKNIALLDNDEEFTVIAGGASVDNNVINTIMVYDSNKNDALANNSKYKREILSFFIHKMDATTYESDFYESYLTTYYPETWQHLAAQMEET